MNGYTLQYYLIRDGLRWESPLGVWLGSHHSFALVGSWFAIFFEATFFLVILFPVLALFYVPAGIGFHALIYLTQRAPFFGYMVLYAALVPWAAGVRYLAERYARPHSARTEICYDGLCPLCIRSMTILAYFDWFGRLRYSDLEVEGHVSCEHIPPPRSKTAGRRCTCGRRTARSIAGSSLFAGRCSSCPPCGRCCPSCTLRGRPRSGL
jgi:hypothetical protein